MVTLNWILDATQWAIFGGGLQATHVVLRGLPAAHGHCVGDPCSNSFPFYFTVSWQNLSMCESLLGAGQPPWLARSAPVAGGRSPSLSSSRSDKRMRRCKNNNIVMCKTETQHSYKNIFTSNFAYQRSHCVTSCAVRPHYLMWPSAASWENRQVPWVCLRACWVSQTSPNPRGLNIAPSWEAAYFRPRSVLQEFNLFIDRDGSRIPRRTCDSSCCFPFDSLIKCKFRTAWALFVTKTNRLPARPRQPLTQRALNK